MRETSSQPRVIRSTCELSVQDEWRKGDQNEISFRIQNSEFRTYESPREEPPQSPPPQEEPPDDEPPRDDPHDPQPPMKARETP